MWENESLVIQAVQTQFAQCRCLVIGDLMLDQYVEGVAKRISPEAPVPIVEIKQQFEVPGGAANVAHNLALLGLNTRLVGLIGGDQAGNKLMSLLAEAHVDTSGIVSDSSYITTTKMRILGGQQQMIRLDREREANVSSEVIEKILRGLHQPLEIIILSDYAKGVLSEFLCQSVIQWARKKNIPILVDPKGKNYEKYRGATGLLPNYTEFQFVTGLKPAQSLVEVGQKLIADLDLDFLVVTQGELGMTLIYQNDYTHFPAQAHEVFDVSGAGDTVIATLAAAIAAKVALKDGLRLANAAAGYVVTRAGTVPINRERLLALLSPQKRRSGSKVLKLPELLSLADEWRIARETIVFTNGCFDLLHSGHLTLLEQARSQGDHLVVGINSDASVRQLKGHMRPIIPESEREHMLAALSCVDAVIRFDSETPLDLIIALQPHVLVKGSDYTPDQVAGAEQLKKWNGRLYLVPLQQNCSTTQIIQKIQDYVSSNRRSGANWEQLDQITQQKRN